MTWCNTLGAEPFICLNMGTGTLEDALAWLEYMNGTAQTLYANMRRKNGHEEPYKVKYLALGNEVWGPWQVGQAEARDCKLVCNAIPVKLSPSKLLTVVYTVYTMQTRKPLVNGPKRSSLSTLLSSLLPVARKDTTTGIVSSSTS